MAKFKAKFEFTTKKGEEVDEKVFSDLNLGYQILTNLCHEFRVTPEYMEYNSNKYLSRGCLEELQGELF